MELQKLIYTVEDSIAIITMNYMKNLNAIDEQMAEELFYAFDMAEKDPAVRVVVLKGPQKAFSSGGDIGYFYDQVQSGAEVNIDELSRKVGLVADQLRKLSKLVITSVRGAAAGAGASLGLAGDFVMCADNARFILAFSNLGLAPDTGVTYLLSKNIGPARTMELAVTGRPMGAEEAKELGLVYQVVPAEELDEATMKLAKKLAAGPLVSYCHIKKQIYNACYFDYQQWLAGSEQPSQSACAATEDFKEGCRAFMEKRKPSFTGR